MGSHGSHHGPIHPNCLNCGAALTGPFCAACGQHDIDYHRSIGHIVEESLEGLVHFDGKFIATVRYLFTRPGFLTREFNAGRRVSYAHPLRFYIFASFLYFLLTAFYPTQLWTVTVKPDHQTASANVTLSPSWFDEAAINGPEFTREVIHLMPEALFVCVPILALLLKWAYRRSGRLYVEHLIFAFHTQALFFLSWIIWGAVGLLIRHWNQTAGGVVESVLSTATLFLIYRGFHAVYGESRLKSVLKFAAVGISYFFVFALVLAGTVVAAAVLVSRENGHPKPQISNGSQWRAAW